MVCSVLWTLPMFHCNGWCFTWAVTAVGGRHICLGGGARAGLGAVTGERAERARRGCLLFSDHDRLISVRPRNRFPTDLCAGSAGHGATQGPKSEMIWELLTPDHPDRLCVFVRRVAAVELGHWMSGRC